MKRAELIDSASTSSARANASWRISFSGCASRSRWDSWKRQDRNVRRDLARVKTVMRQKRA